MSTYEPDHDMNFYLSRGEYFQAEGLTIHALKAFNQAVTVAPQEVEVYLSRAEFLRREGKMDEALIDLHKAVAIDSANPESYTLIAQILWQNRHFTEALEMIEKAENIDNNWDRIYLIKGDIYNSLQDYSAALTAYNRAVHLVPDNIDNIVSLCSVLIKSKEFSHAQKLIGKTIKVFPNNGWLYYYRGLIYSHKCLVTEALVEFSRSAKLLYDSIEPVIEKAGLLQRLGRYEEALADYKWCLKKDIDAIAELYYNMGECYWHCSNIKKAIIFYTKAIDNNLKDCTVFLSLAEAYLTIGKRKKAAECFNKAAIISPHNADVYAGRGSLYLEMGNIDAAEKDINHALRLDSGLPEAFLTRATIRQIRGDKDGAISDYATASHLIPDDIGTIFRWINAVANTGDVAEALHILERILKKKDDLITDLLLLKGDLYIKLSREQEALNTYFNVLEMIPDDFEPLLRIAELYKEKKQYKEALEYYSKAIDLLPAESMPYLHRAALLRKLNRNEEADKDERLAILLRRQRGH